MFSTVFLVHSLIEINSIIVVVVICWHNYFWLKKKSKNTMVLNKYKYFIWKFYFPIQQNLTLLHPKTKLSKLLPTSCAYREHFLRHPSSSWVRDDVRVVFRDLTDFCFNFEWKLLPEHRSLVPLASPLVLPSCLTLKHTHLPRLASPWLDSLRCSPGRIKRLQNRRGVAKFSRDAARG